MRDLCEVTEPRSHCSCRDMMGSSDDLNAAMDGYILFRKDKPAMWGGGTALFVREKLECIELFLGLYEKHEKRGWVRIQGKATWIILLWVFATSQAIRNKKLDFYNHLEGASLTGHGGELQHQVWEFKKYLHNVIRHMLWFLGSVFDRFRSWNLMIPCGSLPTPDIIWFYDSVVTIFLEI